MCRFDAKFIGPNKTDDTAGWCPVQKNFFWGHETLFVQVEHTMPATRLQSDVRQIAQITHGAVNARHSFTESLGVTVS